MGRRFLEQNTTQSTLSGSGSQQMNLLGNRGRVRTQPSVKRSYDIGGVDGHFSLTGMSSNPCFICGNRRSDPRERGNFLTGQLGHSLALRLGGEDNASGVGDATGDRQRKILPRAENGRHFCDSVV